MKLIWTVGARRVAGLAGVLFLAVAGCERKEDDATNPAPAGDAEGAKKELAAAPDPAVPVGESGPAPEAPKAEPAPVPAPAAAPAPKREREAWTLKHAGFAASLPPDTDFYADARKLGWAWDLVEKWGWNEKLEEILDSPVVQEFQEEAERELGFDLVEEAKEMIPLLLQEDAFVAARGLSLGTGALLEISVEVNRIVGRELTRSITSGTFLEAAGDDFGADMPGELSKWLLRNVEKISEDRNVALYLGGRVPEEKRGEVADRIAEQLTAAAGKSDMLESVSWKRGEVTWKGFQVTLGDFDGFEDAEPLEGMTEEGWARMMEIVGSWAIAVAVAEVDDFVVMAVGLGQESIALAESAETSLAASSAFGFFEEFDAKAVHATTWASKALLEGMTSLSSYLPFFEGVEEGLKKSPNLRHGAEMVKAVSELNRIWRARRSGSAHDHVSVVLVEDEVRIESRGGWLRAGTDLVTPLKFAKAFDPIGDKLFVRSHWKKDAKHIALGKQWVAAGMRFLRVVAEESMDLAVESAAEDEDGDRAEDMRRWKRDLLNGIDGILKGYEEHFSTAFGTESAFVMDLEGKMIPAVGVDEEAVNKGRIPRAAYVRPVVKREALTESWALWNRALTNLFGILAEAIDQPIPFPDTMTAEKNDLRTYFFPFPFATDDFLPSVSVSDELFILGSSKTLSESLYEASRAADQNVVEPGMRVDVNADPLWDFCEVWLDIYEENRAAKEKIEEDELRKLQEEGEGPKGGPDVPAELKDFKERADGLGVELDPEMFEELSDLLEDEDPPEELKKELREALERGVAPSGDEENDQKQDLKVVPPAKEGEPDDGDDAKKTSELEELEEFQTQRLETDELLRELGKPDPKPEEEVEDLLLRQLLDEAHDAEPHQLVIPAAELDLPLQGDDADGEEEYGGPLGMSSYLPDSGTLREILEKARWFRGVKYRRWLEDGVPRATLRVKWEAPGGKR